IDELTKQPTDVTMFAAQLYAASGDYNSAAGIVFALDFKFASLEIAALFHDSDFYGAKIVLGWDTEKQKSKLLQTLQGFEFVLVYRKISPGLGVYAGEIFFDLGEIEVGAASLQLPSFSVSIWTNGDWRFAIGWPIDNHPITIGFQV